MGNFKNGLDYFSFDVDFFDDPKVEFISAKFGIKGEIIAVKLLCKIYRNGYYLHWDDDQAVLFAKRVGDNMSNALVNSVVLELVRRGFFDETIFNSFSVLTSRGIQKRYFEASKRRKNSDSHTQYLLVNPKLSQNVNILTQNECNLFDNVDILKQSKVKESKVKESSCSSSDNSTLLHHPPLPPPSQESNNDNNSFHHFYDFTSYDDNSALKLAITDLFLAFVKKTPHISEITRIFNLITTTPHISRATGYKTAVKCFEDYPLLAENKRNTQYLASKIKGTLQDTWNSHLKKRAAEERNKQLSEVKQRMGTPDETPLDDDLTPSAEAIINTIIPRFSIAEKRRIRKDNL